MAVRQTNSDMEKNQESNRLEVNAFTEWHPQGVPGSRSFDVGPVKYGTDGVFRIELLEQGKSGEGRAELAFEAPLAIRIVGEGSLMSYWKSGFAVHGHSLFVASKSEFLSWLESSSSGVHGADRVKHYAVFSDDACVEVLSADSPSFILK